MKIDIQIDEKYKESKVIIQASQMNEEVKNIYNKLIDKKESLKGYIDDEIFFLKEQDIETIYSEDSKVYALSNGKKYMLKSRLYELENILSAEKFVRISNSEIINLDKVEKINSKLLGTIGIHFYSGYNTYTSRRYMKQIKDILGI